MTVVAIDQVVTDRYALYHGDSVDVLAGLPSDSIHFTMYSPPFVGLYKFSNNERDLSNSEDEDFWQHYAYIIREVLRITKPGRICAVHCMQLPRTKTAHGAVGMYDFRGDVIRAHEREGWISHSEVCVWKDPVIAQQRTKSVRLLHAQIERDSCISGQGLADYVVTFRKPGDNEERVAGYFDQFVGTDLDISRAAYEKDVARLAAEGKKAWPFEKWVSILVWQKYASPVWSDIDQTRTLQNRKWNPAAKDERDERDEQHISPLQLDVIERCIDLWSNPDDVVLTPFLGIGSEVWAAVNMGRKGVGIELKPSYFEQAKRNLAALNPSKKAIDLFSREAAE